jgi:hypothetical protein
MARAPTPTPAKNTTRVGPNDQGVTRVQRPGQNSSIPSVSSPETSVLADGDAKRGEYYAESRRAAAAMANRIADLERSEGASGQTGRDAASAHGGVGDYLSSD